MTYYAMQRRPLRWAGLLMMVAAGMILLQQFRGPDLEGRAYARAVAQLQQVRTMTCTVRLDGGTSGTQSRVPPPAHVYYRAPGLWRVEQGGGKVLIMNRDQNKMILLDAAAKEYRASSIGELPSKSAEAAFLDDLQTLQSLPGKADRFEGGKLDGRPVHIYWMMRPIGLTTARSTLYLDDASGAILRYEMSDPAYPLAARLTATDFEFDQPIDDALFDMTPPADYHINQAAAPSTPDSLREHQPIPESAFVDRLRTLHEIAPDTGFEVFDPMQGDWDILLKKINVAFTQTPGAPPGTVHITGMTQPQIRSAIMGNWFFMQMKPENDFHYEGEGKRWGNAGDDVAWWMPTGSKTYRVLHGDLSITDAATPPEGGTTGAK